MPSLLDYKDHLIRSDYGMLFLVALTALGASLIIFLYRKWATAPGMILDSEDELQDAFASHLNLKLPRLNIVVVLIVGLVLRLPLMSQSFWYDEAFTQRLTTLSLAQLPAAIMADTHPPLFYSLIWLWSRIVGSHSEFLLRLPSLGFGLLFIYLLYRLVKAAGLSETTALIAALLCAVTPSAIYYATELRNYAMLTCAVFGSLLCILEDRPKGFILCTVLVGWLHNLGLFYVPILCLGALLYHHHVLITLPLQALAKDTMRHANQWIHYERLSLVEAPAIRHWSMRRWVIASILAGALSLLWLPLTLQQSNSISDGFWIYFNPAVPAWLFSLNLIYVPVELIFPLLLPYIGLNFLGFYGARRFLLKTTPGRLLLLVMIGVPLLSVLVSLIWAPVFLPRIFLPLTLLMLVPLAETIHRQRTTILPGAVILSLAGLAVLYATAAPLTRPDYKAIIQDGCQGATGLYATAIDTAITVSPYWDASEQGNILVWGGSSDRGGTFKPGQLPLYGFEPGEISDLKGQTVCMVYIFTPRTLEPEREKVAEIVRQYSTTVQEFKLHDELEVDVYQVEVS